MKCLACLKVIDWRSPIIYLEGDRAIHLDEFMKQLESDDLFRREIRRLQQRDCNHLWESMYQGQMRQCRRCNKKELM